MRFRHRLVGAGALIAIVLSLETGPVSADEAPTPWLHFDPPEWSEASEGAILSDRAELGVRAPGRDWLGLGNWGGLARDTAFLLGYQLIGVGIFYVLPESVSQWSDTQKENASFSRWWDNVQHATWDKDTWWINAGHAYFGAAYYVRARERGFGELPSFLYSALASSLYEYGIEAFFERPSYQDLIVTPVGGALLGALIFEPIRNIIKAKAELKWYDHVLLIASDPLGAGSYVIERLIGIKSEIRVDARPPAHAQVYLPSRVGGAAGGQERQHAEGGGVSIELRVRWY